MWEKLWHRVHIAPQPTNETQELKEQRLKKEQKAKRNKAFNEKESYRWVEAFSKIEKLFSGLKISGGGLLSKIIHVFDREGDIGEVFAQISQTKNTGIVVRAAHNRCLEGENGHLWEYVTKSPVGAMRFCEMTPPGERSPNKYFFYLVLIITKFPK
ncbi:hypothetical protein LC653_39315 [Nostoc sp. CHAB 5784]|uniref:hypothetical protein n=1 Tax=Nostoc mirabile TaxID=2907820 RepID=UPI001E370C4A|nr:hypothetical protein [Nostoc mirabile]MCC5669700.1 hypothetical protein [Nostoc mirabile CHAB5784]